MNIPSKGIEEFYPYLMRIGSSKERQGLAEASNGISSARQYLDIIKLINDPEEILNRLSSITKQKQQLSRDANKRTLDAVDLSLARYADPSFIGPPNLTADTVVNPPYQVGATEDNYDIIGAIESKIDLLNEQMTGLINRLPKSKEKEAPVKKKKGVYS